ncbi:hypothetical protein ACFTQL_28860 [Peribacillus butanolivorans]|uniref:Uncharacterized protein n=1 Tax=Peribacillus butanolivorans TaxID=421767 RepID=A0ABM6XQE4_9BACI|nr:hypothetical protein [Peribacillus butanolivorans]AXN40674.1 hypothetical protein DTO10_21360 [Peribacillus butanolivorans]QNU05442.1 hypothetical protein GM240_17040 [Peribacillus butanolivorans]
MDKEKQLVIPLDGLIKLKDNSTRLFIKYKFVILTLVLGVLLYQLVENQIITDLQFFVSAFKILTTYILPWGIFFCLIQIMRKIK